MKRNYFFSLFLAITLLLSLCCTGCGKQSVPTAPADPAATEPDPTTPAEPEPGTPEDVPVRWQNAGALSFLPEEPVAVPKLSEMVYTRPDAEALIGEYEALTEKVPMCEDAEELLNDYYAVAQHFHHFSTMYELAFYLYSADTSDAERADEYDYCDEQAGILEEKQAALYAAFAASPWRDELEEAYFGGGFFADYDGFNAGGQTYLELKQQENDLLFQYYELASAADYSSAREIERNHEASGSIFIELVKVRQQIAEAKGYDDYMDYSYACDYMRDYSTAQAREYLDQVKALLAPLTDERFVLGDYSDWNESKSMEMLSAAAEGMGGPIWEAFRFMSEYELYDVGNSSHKMSAGYTDYLADFEAPFLFVDPRTKDLLYTLFHEYGHFTDAYCNYGFSGSYEISETYSQAMEYLAFKYAEPFADWARARNLRAVLADLLVYSVLQTGAYADFEMQVYALAPEELSVERLDAIFGQCMEDYGIAGMSGVRLQSNYWSVYQHFFSYPGYVISYSDSAVAAMQICRLEAEEPGAGVDAFCRLLDRTHGKKFAAVLEEVGLDSPFEAATLEKTAAFLRDAFKQN